MSDATSLVPPPPDVAERWLDDSSAKHRHKAPLTGGLGRARNGVGGGRWLVWIGRVVLWGTVVVLLLNGIASLRRPVGPAPAPAASPTVGASFPVKAAEAFAARFAHDYLTWDAAAPDVRAEAIAPYLAGDVDRQLGWASIGQQIAVLVLPTRTDVVSDNTALVTVAAQITGLNAPRWVYLQVPVYADSPEQFLVTDAPALVPPPGKATPPPEPLLPTDPTVADQLREPLIAFFKAYAGSTPSELSYLLAPGAQIGTLNSTATFEDLQLTVPEGEDRRDVVAEVRWSDRVTSSTFTQTYQVTVVRREDGRWYIEKLGAHPAIIPSPDR
ncbi:MAG: conjugal transfer protein [Egibacteraceae bacterium]